MATLHTRLVPFIIIIGSIGVGVSSPTHAQQLSSNASLGAVLDREGGASIRRVN